MKAKKSKKELNSSKQADNLSIKGSFEDVIGVTVGVIPKQNSKQDKKDKKDNK